jgi:phage shock protein C
MTDPSGFGDLPAPRLWRSRSNRVIAGVIGGLAEKYDWDPLPVRLLYGLVTVFSGGVLAIPYFAIWAITRVHGESRSEPRLWRSRRDKVIGGVLGGMAEKFNVQPAVLRVLFAAFALVSGGVPAILIYLVLWAVTRPLDEMEGIDSWRDRPI